jgi:hypothetical protein
MALTAIAIVVCAPGCSPNVGPDPQASYVKNDSCSACPNACTQDHCEADSEVDPSLIFRTTLRLRQVTRGSSERSMRSAA